MVYRFCQWVRFFWGVSLKTVFSEELDNYKVELPEDFAIAYIVNNNKSYLQYLYDSIYSLILTHNVDIYIVCLDCADLVSSLLTSIISNYKNKITIIDIDLSKNTQLLLEDFKQQKHHFAYIKPIALKFLIDHESFQNKRYLLYLDTDTYILRNLTTIYKKIQSRCLIVKELGVKYEELGWHAYINNKELYSCHSYFSDISNDSKWLNGEDIPNTGLLGLDVLRDRDIIDVWTKITQLVLTLNLKNYIRWWDQGCLMVALEKQNQKNILSQDRHIHTTVLHHKFTADSMATVPSHVIHFIGQPKVNLQSYEFKNEASECKKLDFLQILVAGHQEEQFDTIQPRSYLKFINLETQQYSNKSYASNSLGEARVFLADNIIDDSCSVLGTVTASWNHKYFPWKIDYMSYWPQMKIIQKLRDDSSIVVCPTICKGIYAAHDDPLWDKNFQKHFRNSHPNSDNIGKTLYKITGLKYDGLRPAPYGNQIICHKTLFYDLCDFVRSHIDSIINALGSNLIYEGVDEHRPLAYVVEELTMLWWANQPSIHYVPVVEIVPEWYQKGYVRTRVSERQFAQIS